MKKIIELILKFFKREGIYYVGSCDALPPPLSKEE